MPLGQCPGKECRRRGSQASVWAWSTFKGSAEEEGQQRKRRRCCWGVGRNQETSDSDDRQMFLESQGGLQGHGSQKSILWNGQLGAGIEVEGRGGNQALGAKGPATGVDVEAVSVVGESRETGLEKGGLEGCVRALACVHVFNRSREGAGKAQGCLSLGLGLPPSPLPPPPSCPLRASHFAVPLPRYTPAPPLLGGASHPCPPPEAGPAPVLPLRLGGLNRAFGYGLSARGSPEGPQGSGAGAWPEEEEGTWLAGTY